jgi:hypothetical protein
MKPKKCKYCKDKFQPIRSLQSVCSFECAIEYDKILKEKKWKKEKAKKKKELMTLQDWIKIAQATFNTYIRLEDKSLGNPCMSCRKPLESKYDAGHFYNANNHWNLRFDERNVFSQCVYCNRHLHGNLLEYRKQLLFYYGESFLAQLEKDSKITRKFTIDEVKEINEIYKQKIKDLKK